MPFHVCGSGGSVLDTDTELISLASDNYADSALSPDSTVAGHFANNSITSRYGSTSTVLPLCAHRLPVLFRDKSFCNCYSMSDSHCTRGDLRRVNLARTAVSESEPVQGA
eukprot:SAG31_NODE_3855_length_3815_cov_12.889128_3_plen_110_part_00